MNLAQTIDGFTSEDVVVVGSPPPGGRDLDLLARPSAYASIARLLTDAGFRSLHSEWIRFDGCSAEAIDLLSAADLGLTESVAGDVFAAAHPLPGFDRLRRPAPHHLLLMLARWTTEGRGRLSDKRRTRIRRLLEEDPHAWSLARREAAAWRATRSLAALERAFTRNAAGMTRRERAAALAEAAYAPGRTRPRALIRAWIHVLRPSRTRDRLISLSGLDGAGKSSQAQALQDTLERLGFDVAVQWTRLEWTTLWENRWLGVLGWPARGALSFLSRIRRRKSGAEKGESPPLEPAALRERSTVISQVWVAIVALAHAAAQRKETRAHLGRGKVVICDRYTLDTAVHLRFRYGERRNFGWQIGLVQRLSPRPIVAFLLDVPAATARARKAEQYSLDDLERQSRLYREESTRLNAHRLEGERPREDLCAEIAEVAWRALRAP